MSLWNQQEKKIQPQDNGRVSCSEVPQLSKLLKHIPNGKKDSVCSYTLCKVRARRCILKGSQCEMLKISLCQSDISRFDNKEPLGSSAETPNQEAMLSLFYPPWAGFLGTSFSSNCLHPTFVLGSVSNFTFAIVKDVQLDQLFQTTPCPSLLFTLFITPQCYCHH